MTSVCKCIFDSQIAYIINDINDNIDKDNKITIIDYLNNKKIQKKVKKGKIFLVCEYKQELIKYESNMRCSHFKHKNIENNNNYNEMSEWHRNWQNNFDIEKQEICIGNRRADVCIDNNVIEFQHSKISIELVDERNKNYTENNKNILWVIECNNDIQINIIEKEYNIEFINNYWKYDSFINCDYIFLDNNNDIYKIEPTKIKNNFIKVNIKKSKEEFINSLKYNIDIWNDYVNIELGKIYINQRGAGCGKTYESIQLKNDKKFKDKEFFIYLTKMNSAVNVIHKEFTEQYERKDFIINLDKDSQMNEQKDYIGQKMEKKIKINYTDNNVNKQIIIATIDSFMYAIGDKNTKGNDFFKDLVKSLIIADGYSNNVNKKTGKIKKGGFSSMTLNNKCIIIIDEAQDLESNYIEACEKIINKTGIDLYIIGDKLQSILEKNNVFTHFIEKHKNKDNIIFNIGMNHVKRFHNNQFIDFVNNHVKFEKYGLESIQQICDKIDCIQTHKDNEKPYKIFEIPEIYHEIYNDIDEKNDENYTKINNTIKYIIEEMDKQIKNNNYLPEDFMFIFPLIKKNYLARMLEEKIQQFWLDKFKDETYKTEVLNKNKYWKNKIDDNIYYKFAHLHFSTEGKPINLDESKYATRMVSIHASKGDGRNVVFLLGISEYSLSIFNKDMYCEEKDNLIYESLLHVALTRQKRFIYIGINKNNDDIYRRFKDCDIIDFNNYHENNLRKINKNYTLEKIIDYILNNEEEFNKFNNIIIGHKIKLDELWIENKTNNKKNIDWGHHTLRNAVFKFNILSELLKDENINTWNNTTKQQDIEFNQHQFIKKMDEISKKNINICKWNEFCDILENITKNYKKQNYEKNITIPILEFSNRSPNSKHNKYKDFIMKNIINIQNKIKEHFAPENDRIPILCPLESVIYYYCKQVINNGMYYEEPTMMNVYDILYYIDNAYDNTCIHSYKYNCLCDSFFKNNINDNKNDDTIKICKSYTEHYIHLQIIKNMCENFDKYVLEYYNFEHKKLYNEDQKIFLAGNNNDFNIRNTYELLGHNDKYIINFIIEPQFCKLTYNKIFIRMLLEQYLVKKSVYKHKYNKKRDIKKIIHCIFSLDNEQPYFYNEDELYLEENNLINNTIEKYIKQENNKYYEIIYDFYHTKLKETNNDYRESFTKLNSSLNEINNKNNSIPLHIINYMKKIEEQINDIDKDCDNNIELFNKEFENDRVTKKLLDKQKFIESINGYFIYK